MTTIEFNPDDSLSEFIISFEASLDIRLWNKLVEEETAELLDAMREDDKLNGLKEMVDVVYVVSGAGLVQPEDLDRVVGKQEWKRFETSMAEAVMAFNAAQDKWHFSAEVLSEAFHRVHASNMSKLGGDGKPIRREDGKILKGPNYKTPDLTDLVFVD